MNLKTCSKVVNTPKMLLIELFVKNVFKNSNIVLAQKQPKRLLRLLCKARFNTDTKSVTTPIQPKGLF